MPTSAPETLLLLLLTVLFVGLLVELARVDQPPAPSKASHHRPRPLQPRTADDCPQCRRANYAPAPAVTKAVLPYTHLKSRRGRKKTIDTTGYACPYHNCPYFNNPDPQVHALVGYGHHGRRDPIQDFYCQACHHKFTARRNTPLYRLKTLPATVAQVLHAVAEGLSLQAAARVFDLPEATVRTWLTRAGQHSHALHRQFLRCLYLTHVQLDELRFKLRGATEATWLWVACDAQSKLIPAFTLGPRTQALAHQLVHELSTRLAADCLPVFSSDGLALYYYALTAHFGHWLLAAGERRRSWVVEESLLYAQVIKHYRRHRLERVERRVCLGQPEAFQTRLCALGLSGRIQTAFIERLNLTIRRSLAALARRSWSSVQSLGELTLQFEWWRVVYHFARPHTSLRVKQSLGENALSRIPQRYRQRTPAQAVGLTDHRWTVLEVLAYPAPT
jgi:transposase-like protein/IS1 family transposase